MIDFSVIIPAKNEEKYIGDCLSSILNQNYDRSKFEIIVVDNGSTDATVDITREKGALVFIRPDLNISGLRNFGARHARGRVLAFLDADCTVSPEWLSAAYQYIANDDIVSFGSPAVIPKQSTWVQRVWFHIRKNRGPVEEVAWHESANFFVMRETFVSAGGFNEDLVTCEDYEISARLKHFGTLISDNRIKAVHHREPATLPEFIKKERWRAINNYLGFNLRDIPASEWPSIVIPLVYLFVLLLFFTLAVSFAGGVVEIEHLTLYFLTWQLPILGLAVWKVDNKSIIPDIIGLYILLNAYFFARGSALFGRTARQ